GPSASPCQRRFEPQNTTGRDRALCRSAAPTGHLVGDGDRVQAYLRDIADKRRLYKGCNSPTTTIPGADKPRLYEDD
ncbi:MAG TPA: hypothetical protein VL485_21905, partial [Ktedonobacteraceae bacterium]|nr:hypothetical protein [Ktedonobacteraceae bacterium]